MRDTLKSSLLACLALSLPAPHDALAQELERPESEPDLGLFDLQLDELAETPVEVWAATKGQSTILEAPSVVTVVTRDDIQRFGYQSVAEVLQHQLGFYAVDDHVIPNFGVRGIAGGFMGESGTLKVMIDGQNAAARSTGGNWLGPEFIPLSAIERIEIIRGPVSALYGADAFLGVVNVITVAGEDISLGKLSGGASVTQYNGNGYDADGVVGGRRGSVDFVFSGRVNREDRSGLRIPDSSPAPRVPSYNEGDPQAHELRLDSQVAHGKLSYHYQDLYRLSLTGRIARLERAGEFSPWAQLTHGVDESGRERGTLIALYESLAGLQFTLIPSEFLTLDWRAAYTKGGPTSDDRIDVGSDTYYVRRDFGHDTLETSIEGSWRISDDLASVTGLEFTSDWENLPSSLRVLQSARGELSANDTVESTSIRQGSAQLRNAGAFAQLEFSGLKPYLDITGGARLDNHSLYGNQVSGRMGVVSNPIAPIHIKLLWGSAFKAPAPLLLYGVPHQVLDITGNPDLKPQKVQTFEGQVIAKPTKFLQLTTGVAYSLLFDKAEFIQRGINRSAVNVSRVKSLSAESELAISFTEWSRATLGFESQWSEREFGEYGGAYYTYLVGGRSVIYPKYILRGGLSGRVEGVPLQGGIDVMYVGDRPSSEMNALENVGMYELPAYLSLGASVSSVGVALVGDRETVFTITGRNLTSQNAADPGFAGVDYPRVPLSVAFRVTQEL